MVVAMLQLDRVTAGFQEDVILADLSLDILPGRLYGIIGPNGAGKTTLLKVMTGVKKPHKGGVRLKGDPLSGLSGKKVARTMAVVPQSSFIPPLFTVEEVVAMGRYPHQGFGRTDTVADLAHVNSAMEKTGISLLRRKAVYELSGGQRQKVIIARALAQAPEILMLDEPTSNLDIKHQMGILGLTRKLVDEGKLTAVMVIHDLNLAARFCDQLILLHNKKVAVMGTPEAVLTRESIKAAFQVDAVVRENQLTRSLETVVIQRSDRQQIEGSKLQEAGW